MKTIINASLGLILILAVSCGPKAKAVKAPNGEKEIELPCSNFTKDKKFFRVSAVGESKDLNIAKRKALSNARTQLSGEIAATMKVVGDNYVKSSEQNNVEEALERFEENSRTIINQQLNGAQSVCERVTKNPKTKSFSVYVALELSAKDLADRYNESLSKDQQTFVDYNYEKFKKTFEEEMSKQR